MRNEFEIIEQWIKPGARVLDLGCGALSQGKPLIEYLDYGKYVGLDPNGWLIEAALEEYPELLTKSPRFSYEVDFSTEYGPYDYIIAHSVLSHVSDWQLEMALINLRKEVKFGATWLASIRLAGEDSRSRNWMYPGISHYRFGTVAYKAHHAGWSVEHCWEYKEQIVEECPNDFHDWIRFRAVTPPEEINKIRLDDEEKQRKDQEIWDFAVAEYKRREQESYVAE